jgi:hypothetical protein
MFSGHPISFSFGSTSNVNNLVWSTNGSNIFVDYSRNDELFIGSFSISDIIFECFKLHLPIQM